MSRIQITIDTDNAAFKDDEFFTPDYAAQAEVARILRALADRMEEDNVPDVLLDTNGNRCGTVTKS